jgi:tetratricopeptide (TPR) repeat protein
MPAMSPAQPTAASLRREVAAIGAVALVVKLVVLMQLANHPLLQPHGELDTAYYIELSRRVASEGVLGPVGAFVVSPLYVYFLAAVFKAGLSVFAAQLIQTALGAAAVALSFATARHWFGERAAYVAAVLAMLTGLFTFNEVLILQSSLDPFLVSSALYALTRTTAGGGILSFAASGTCLGLLSLNRPNALVFAVAAAVGVAVGQWRNPSAQPEGGARRRQPHGLGRAAVLTAFLALVLGVNSARNYAVSGDLVVIASHGGLNLYIGNHERADGTYTPVPGITPSIAGQAIDSRRVAESTMGRSLSPGEVSSYFAWRAVDWATGHPSDAFRLTIRKVAILLNAVDVPLNYSLAFYAREPGSLLRLLAVGPWVLLPLGLLGLLWSDLRVNRRGYWIWAMFVPVYGVTVVVFFVADRYRMPMFVPLGAAAGAALVRLFDLARARRFAALGWPAASLAALTLLVFANLGLDNGLGGEQTRRAVLLVEQGAIDEARRYVAQIAPAHSHPGVLQFRVGQAMSDAGRYAEAVALFEDAIAADGPQPAIRLALGEAHMKRGAIPEAIGHLEAALDQGFRVEVAGALLVRALVLAGRGDAAARRLPGIPDSVAWGPSAGDVALDFGTVALEHGAAHEAIRWMRIAVASSPDRAEAHEKLGLAVFLGGDARNAVPSLERACELDPGSASAHLNLAAVYAALGRFAEARRLANDARRLDPAEPRVAALLEALPR